MYLFGFGSLINLKSAQKSFTRVLSQNDLIPVEIKGYKSLEWEAKHEANKDISVLYGLDLKPILDYVIEKYGKDFIFMYEQDGR